MSNFIQSYELILENLSKLSINFDGFVQIRKPKLSNTELIALNLTAQYLQINSECQLFRVIESSFLATKIERSVYNRRKRKLFPFIEEIRRHLSQQLSEFENYFIVDSMPLELCKNARVNRSRICKENLDTAPSKGFCAAQQLYYYGYKLHAVCTIAGVFTSIDFSAASVHDIHYLKNIQSQIKRKN